MWSIIRVIRKMFKIMGYDFTLWIRKFKKIYDIDLYHKIYGNETVENRRFYNIGAGGFQHPAWTNVDHESEWYRMSKVVIWV